MYHNKEIKEIFSELKTSEEGLTEEEAKKRLEKYKRKDNRVYTLHMRTSYSADNSRDYMGSII